MLVYREVKSMVKSRILGGRSGGKWLESLMCEGLEVEVNKSRNPLSDRVEGSNNGADRVIEFVDFREKIEGGGAGIGDMKERDV